ncbi:MAG: HAD-superfamily hydrolase, subfamily IA, variant 3 [Nitrospira sp.]|nr:MAG: HAD-superfamily hydrolase, subfamily IA, variant 3 [Nitrospira sp.]
MFNAAGSATVRPGSNSANQEAALRAIIFDFNGVIADDETPHVQCFQQALAEQGLALTTEEYYGTYLGMDERTCTAALLEKRDGSCDAALHAEIIERKAALFRDHTAQHPPALFPGVVEFVQRAAERYRLAVASGGRREQILAALKNSPIEQASELIVSADECAVGKPDPAIYEVTLRRLNARMPRPPLLRAGECLVIEDSRAGILAGLKAGMRVLALITTYQAPQLSDAHLVLTTLKDIDPADLARRIFEA